MKGVANSSVAIHSNVFSRQFLIKYPWSKCSITNMFNVNISWLMYTKTIVLNANKQKTVVNLTVRWENILMKNLISGSHCFAWTNQLIIFNFFCYLQIERVYLSRGIEYSSHGQWAWILPIVEVHRMHRKSQANWNIYVYILLCSTMCPWWCLNRTPHIIVVLCLEQSEQKTIYSNTTV